MMNLEVVDVYIADERKCQAVVTELLSKSDFIAVSCEVDENGELAVLQLAVVGGGK